MLFLGVLFFFDPALLALGDVLFLMGLTLTIGMCYSVAKLFMDYGQTASDIYRFVSHLFVSYYRFDIKARQEPFGSSHEEIGFVVGNQLMIF